MADDESPHRRALIELLQRGEGTTEDAERWLEQLKALTPALSSSDLLGP